MKMCICVFKQHTCVIDGFFFVIPPIAMPNLITYEHEHGKRIDVSQLVSYMLNDANSEFTLDDAAEGYKYIEVKIARPEDIQNFIGLNENQAGSIDKEPFKSFTGFVTHHTVGINRMKFTCDFTDKESTWFMGPLIYMVKVLKTPTPGSDNTARDKAVKECVIRHIPVSYEDDKRTYTMWFNLYHAIVDFA